jgi:uncharacterized protein YbjT (DUF2867 family)
MTTKRIAVAGGTGWIGRLVVEAAHEAGYETAVLARSAGVDLLSGAGVAAALRGADAVIDVANLNSTSRSRAVSFFGTTSRVLLEAGASEGVSHHVALSIIGVDRVDIGYYAGKVRQEEVVAAGPVPYTIARAAQFFEFAPQMVGHAVGPFVPAPKMLCQPVAAREVAAELVRIAAGPPLGHGPDIAGPEQLWMNQMIKQWLKARGSHRIAVPFSFPGAAGREQARGGLLPRGEAVLGEIRYADWLTSPDSRVQAPTA